MSTSSPDLDYDQWARPLQRSVYGLIFIFGTTGNAVVLYVFMGKQQLLTSGNGFVASLAFTDLLSAIYLVPMSFSEHFDDVTCKCMHFFGYVFLQASSRLLVAIAVERTRAILHPFKPKLSGKFVIGSVLSIYLFAAALSCSEIFSRQVEQFVCDVTIPKHDFHVAIKILFILTSHSIPFVVLTVLYSVSVWSLIQHRRTLRNMTLDKAQDQIRAKRNLKVTVMFAAAFIVFFLATSPFYYQHMVVVISSRFYRSYYEAHLVTFNRVSLFAVMLMLRNCCFNPIIYAASHRKFRCIIKKALKMLYCEGCCQRRRNCSRGDLQGEHGSSVIRETST